MGYRRAARFSWNYDRGGVIANSVMYAIGICFGLIGTINDCDDLHLVGVLR
jgi:hypothetical protein